MLLMYGVVGEDPAGRAPVRALQIFAEWQLGTCCSADIAMPGEDGDGG
jgi:hypothetical protein